MRGHQRFGIAAHEHLARQRDDGRELVRHQWHCLAKLSALAARAEDYSIKITAFAPGPCRTRIPARIPADPSLGSAARPIAENFTAAGRMREVTGAAFGRHEADVKLRGHRLRHFQSDRAPLRFDQAG